MIRACWGPIARSEEAIPIAPKILSPDPGGRAPSLEPAAEERFRAWGFGLLSETHYVNWFPAELDPTLSAGRIAPPPSPAELGGRGILPSQELAKTLQDRILRGYHNENWLPTEWDAQLPRLISPPKGLSA